LQGAGIMAFIGQRKPAGVAQHMRMGVWGWALKASLAAFPARFTLGKSGRSARCPALRSEYKGASYQAANNHKKKCALRGQPRRRSDLGDHRHAAADGQDERRRTDRPLWGSATNAFGNDSIYASWGPVYEWLCLGQARGFRRRNWCIWLRHDFGGSIAFSLVRKI